MVEKAKFTPDFKSIFSMGQYDFERYHKLLLIMDDLSMSVGSGNHPDISSYYVVLRTFYRSIRQLVHAERKETEEVWCRKDFEKAFSDIKPEIERIRKNINQDNKFSFDKNVLDVLENIHTQLMSIKQLVGLGIEVRRDFTPTQKIKRAFGNQ